MKTSYPTMATADEIIQTARSYIGVPFRHMGRSRNGIDCAGLVVCVCRDLEISVVDIPRYGRQPLGGMLEQVVRQTFIETSSVEPGTLLVMRFASEPQHMAIYTGDTIIHSYERVGKCVEHRLDSVWHRRIVSTYRFP